MEFGSDRSRCHEAAAADDFSESKTVTAATLSITGGGCVDFIGTWLVAPL